ncbi:MAG: FAD/NAD(P)-binding oxidoreductase [Acidobacteriota bacterium]|nr:FAD/NAD(P)-binding oxidoreductase [Acidobacteriota bacterium]
MKQILILGAGTAGTMMANHLNRLLPKGWQVTVADPENQHLYQPGLLFLPFGARDEHKIVKSRAHTLKRGVTWLQKAVETVDHEHKTVIMKDGHRETYDILIIASGSHIQPDMTPGMTEDEWYHSIFDFYSLAGARALRDKLADFQEGRLVVNVVEMPIKCPVAPLEFLFLADDYFRKQGRRDRVEIVFVTPLDAAFTKPVAAKVLGNSLLDRGIRLETEFMTGEIDPAKKQLLSYDERGIDFDLLVTVPTHTGADFVEASDIGDELAFIPTDRHTLAAREMEDVFVVGDATDLPSSKAGSVAHFQAELLTENLLRKIRGEELEPSFDGHSNCFVETGDGKAMLIDFNYNVEPVPGRFPYAFGPFSLMRESRMNHWAKLAFRPTYWHALLPGRRLPISAQMSTSGKQLEFLAAVTE